MLMNNSQPLRYKISSWKQLYECKSNNSRHLKIVVGEFVNNEFITGLRIQVVHPEYGVLFSEMLNAHGPCITSLENSGSDEIAFQLNADQILQELRKYGFFISYDPRPHLPENQLESLSSLRGLHFDKLRKLVVYETDHNGSTSFKWYIVGFKSCAHTLWLNNTYSVSRKEFTEALLDGTAMNISEVASMKGYEWGWLDYVANIDDILRDNLYGAADYHVGPQVVFREDDSLCRST